MSVNIDDIINNNDNDNDNEQREEEKDTLLQSDFALTETPKQPHSEAVTADFSEDASALNAKSKVESQTNRFGAIPPSNEDKIESRKRRFGAMDSANASPPAKKQRVDPQKERQKIFERAQKFGTTLPASFKLTV